MNYREYFGKTNFQVMKLKCPPKSSFPEQTLNCTICLMAAAGMAAIERWFWPPLVANINETRFIPHNRICHRYAGEIYS